VTDSLYRLDPQNLQASRQAWNVNTRAISSHADVISRIASTDELRSSATTQSLGTSSIEGLAVEGTRQTLTVPAGEDGNERSITIVLETWRSPELQVAVLAKYENSKVGRNTTRLTKIDRSEPDAGLFQVPMDYTIEDAPTREGEPVGR
jgi:hypothetical protein